MKKLLIIAIICAMSATANAQIKFGGHFGVPVGDLSEFYSFTLGADLYYMFGHNPDGFLKFGVATGYINYFGSTVDILGQDVDIDNASFIPIAGAVRITILKFITFGPDFGYGFGVSNGIDGGFYWRLVGGIDFGNAVEVNLFYHSISADGGGEGSSNTSFNTLGIGLLFQLGKNKKE
ncbi:hypothetical protein [Fulvivirga sedimenti]|uniref:Outer membrane protein beta-barrel domain-containing protein n=1 Tax=Fulvivirga sedimenti TaxID=2879465 RepID=A0A9X1KW17_9BACT|nr:hypothetical protein [Fulvivirga sedimenti]MCA6073504.1 hypothetical protein [Fulvivirga sedimenti]